MKNLLMASLLSLVFGTSAFAIQNDPTIVNPDAPQPLCSSKYKELTGNIFRIFDGRAADASLEDVTITEVNSVKPIKSPNGKSKYQVLETYVLMGKMGEYRVHLIYALTNQKGVQPTEENCQLMGQEILNMSSL